MKSIINAIIIACRSDTDDELHHHLNSSSDFYRPTSRDDAASRAKCSGKSDSGFVLLGGWANGAYQRGTGEK